MRRERGGFTLIELLVALAIGAVVLMSARALLDGLASHARATVRAMHDTDAEGNGERLARQLDREHRVMLGLARALRLTVASCHDPITAGRKARATAASADPWRAIG